MAREGRRCGWCGKPLEGQQQKWCSPEHGWRAWDSDHPRARTRPSRVAPHRRKRAPTFRVVDRARLAACRGGYFVQPNVRRIEKALASGQHVEGVEPV